MNDDDIFIRKLYARNMLASMMALFFHAIGQIVSAIIIGNRLESSALSVMAVVLPIQSLFAMAGALLAVGGTTLCARSIGKGRFEECHRVFTLVYLLTALTAVFLAFFLQLFIDPVVRFLGASPEIFENTKLYAVILIGGAVFSMSIFPAFNLLRLDGRSRSSVIVFFSMAAVNILLDIVLLLGLRVGVEGAAIAAVVSAAVSGGFGAMLLFTRSKNFHLIALGFKKKPPRDDCSSNSKIIRDIIVLGSPSAMEYLCILAYTIVLNKLISGSFGLFALSSFKLIDSINSIALVFIFGVSGPIIQFVGVFSAEKDSKSIRQLLVQVFKWGVLFVFGYALLCELFAPYIAALFGMASPDTLAVAVPAIRIFAASLVLALINTILIYIYQAGNRPLLANIITVSRLLLWIIIIAPILSARIGVTGIWHSFWIGESLTLLTVVILSLFYRRGNKYLSPVLLLDTEAELKGIYKSFSVKNTLENITQSSEGIIEFCEQNDMSPKLTMAISLAIEEMLVVIREHSLSDDIDETMNVRVLIADNTVILRIRNGGKTFNPVEYVEKAGEAEAVDVMGIKMILALAKKIDYRNTFGINNITVLLQRQKTTK
jgi:putative MATE family efflux protein